MYTGLLKPFRNEQEYSEFLGKPLVMVTIVRCPISKVLNRAVPLYVLFGMFIEIPSSLFLYASLDIFYYALIKPMSWLVL